MVSNVLISSSTTNAASFLNILSNSSSIVLKDWNLKDQALDLSYNLFIYESAAVTNTFSMNSMSFDNFTLKNADVFEFFGKVTENLTLDSISVYNSELKDVGTLESNFILFNGD